MFAVWCPRHRSQVLLSPASIRALEATPEGIRIGYRCTCGHEGVSPPVGPRRVAA
ncbi:MAG: hypothetical protein ACRD0O_14240 [Acidimicrobiia bacterium]